jgi:thymidylate synthase ThyX
MPPQRQVYLLDPKSLSPETIAVTFAKTSRSPQTFRQIAAELTDEKSADFNEKWVVGYGHASVAEHALLHLAVENVSRLAIECLESNRLASYTEKSTRYQKWSPEEFFQPAEIEKDFTLKTLYLRTCCQLFDGYQQALTVISAQAAQENPRQPGEDDLAWERRLRSTYVDVCRYFLPAASLANVGVTMNARVLEHAITKMLSHPLDEVRTLGEDIKQVARQELPTLVKYAEAAPYLEKTRHELTAVNIPAEKSKKEDWCQLIHVSPDAEETVLAAALFRYGSQSYSNCLQHVRTLQQDGKRKLAEKILGSLSLHDIPLRELEYATFTFELVMDQGAYFELKRHRMMVQSPQELTTELGYATPHRIVSSGFEKPYHTAMRTAADAFKRIAAVNPHVASYLVPNACLRRVLVQTDLRTLYHFLCLRSAPNAHFALRLVAQRMAEEVKKAAPLLGSFLNVNADENWQQLEKEYFA